MRVTGGLGRESAWGWNDIEGNIKPLGSIVTTDLNVKGFEVHLKRLGAMAHDTVYRLCLGVFDFMSCNILRRYTAL